MSLHIPKPRCPECNREHAVGCNASGAGNCAAERMLCDCHALNAERAEGHTPGCIIGKQSMGEAEWAAALLRCPKCMRKYEESKTRQETAIKEQKMSEKKATFVMACMKVFGRKPNETLPEFNAELKALTEKDRNDLVEMFRADGWEITDYAPKTASAA